jgi:hypothetical protein
VLEEGFVHKHRRENFKSYNLENIEDDNDDDNDN